MGAPRYVVSAGVYCEFTPCGPGRRGVALPYAYHTRALADAMAGREVEVHCADWAKVTLLDPVEAEQERQREIERSWTWMDQEIPF